MLRVAQSYSEEGDSFEGHCFTFLTSILCFLFWTHLNVVIGDLVR